MTDFDPLEAELAGLRPQQPSPRLREQIANRLTVNPPTRFRLLWVGILAGAVAASLTALAILWPHGGTKVVLIEQPDAREALPLATVFAAAAPSVWSYHRALQSSAELDELLDKQASAGPAPDAEQGQLHFFTRSDRQLRTLLGEL